MAEKVQLELRQLDESPPKGQHLKSYGMTAKGMNL
jgi:hypothetical protein